MRKVLVSAVVGGALALSPLAASADPTPTPTPSPTSTLTPAEQYRVDQLKYRADLKSRELHVRAITIAFNEAVAKANREYKSAIAATKSADVKYQAKVALKAAIQLAADNYDAALLEIGPAPVAPTPPSKEPRVFAPKPSKKKN